MLILNLTPYEIVIIVLAWLFLVVGIPVALRLAIARWRRRGETKRATHRVAPAHTGAARSEIPFKPKSSKPDP